MNPGEWKNDPRLAAMDPVKLQYIEKIAAQISSQSKAELFPALLSLQADARKSNISFTDQETTLLISIITSGMPPDEKKKIEMLHFLAKKLAARSSGQPVVCSHALTCNLSISTTSLSSFFIYLIYQNINCFHISPMVQ